MAFGKKKNTESVEEVFAVPQTYTDRHPYASLLSFKGSEKANMKLYASLKEAIPIIDASISKLIRLTGTFEIKCGDAGTEKDINAFLKNVNVGSMSKGISVFLSSYLNQLMTYSFSL